MRIIKYRARLKINIYPEFFQTFKLVLEPEEIQRGACCEEPKELFPPPALKYLTSGRFLIFK